MIDQSMQFILFVSGILLWNVHVNQGACTTPTIVSCTSANATTRVIEIYGVKPTGMCALVQIGNSLFMYNPVSISSVWITLTYKGACTTDVAVIKSSFFSILSSNQEIVALQVKDEYISIVLFAIPCTISCQVDPFSTDLETRLNLAKLPLYAIYNDPNQLGQYCLNGGTINTTYTGAGYKCNCPTTLTAVFTGPVCEIMERKINTKQTFFNVFQNASYINIRFSLFSNGITGVENILAIKNSSFQTVFSVTVNESNINFVSDNGTPLVIPKIIDDQIWYDFNIVLSIQTATMTINGAAKSLPMTRTTGVDFRSYYLVLNDFAQNLFQICIKNLIVNSRIIDLNGPLYVSCCKDRCPCSSTQDCNCRPFVSFTSPTCYCKYGYQSAGLDCVDASFPFSQMTDSVIATVASLTVSPLSRVDFGFRTLSLFGTLLTINLASPVLSFTIQISNTNLTINVPSASVAIINYNVSDGARHVVTVNFNFYSLEMILDSNANYSAVVLNWFNNAALLPTTVISLASISMGAMVKPFNSSINNYSTCFSTVQFNSQATPINVNTTQGSNMSPSCSSGTKCVDIPNSCPSNSVCDDSQWQNTRCICYSNFTSVGSVCVFNLCSANTNPCQKGTCSFNSTTNSTICTCYGGYTGINCDRPPIVDAALWWIAVLIVLIVLLIILILLLLYCFCIRRAKPVGSGIGKINENIVSYNDQAGESDYTGPPINFNLMKNALYKTDPKVIIAPDYLAPELASKKNELEKVNEDLVLDHPLEYGYEGMDSDAGSVSSIGSRSESSEDEYDVDNVNIEFNASLGF